MLAAARHHPQGNESAGAQNATALTAYADANYAVDAYGEAFRQQRILQEKQLAQKEQDEQEKGKTMTTTTNVLMGMKSSSLYYLDTDCDQGSIPSTINAAVANYTIPSAEAPQKATGGVVQDSYEYIDGREPELPPGGGKGGGGGREALQDFYQHAGGRDPEPPPPVSSEKGKSVVTEEEQLKANRGKVVANEQLPKYANPSEASLPQLDEQNVTTTTTTTKKKKKTAAVNNESENSDGGGTEEDEEENSEYHGGIRDSDDEEPMTNQGRVGSEFWDKYYWNEKFQTVLERPTTTSEESRQRTNDIHDLARLYDLHACRDGRKETCQPFSSPLPLPTCAGLWKRRCPWSSKLYARS